MADLIAICHEDEATAAEAAEEVERLSAHLIIQPDAVAVIRRDGDGHYRVSTNHHPVGAGASWGMFWGFLFGVLFFVPVSGLAIGGGIGAMMGKVERSGIDEEFRRQARDMLRPGTSVLFLVVETVTPGEAVAALSSFGGTVLESPLTQRARDELQDALHGSPTAA